MRRFLRITLQSRLRLVESETARMAAPGHRAIPTWCCWTWGCRHGRACVTRGSGVGQMPIIIISARSKSRTR